MPRILENDGHYYYDPTPLLLTKPDPMVWVREDELPAIMQADLDSLNLNQLRARAAQMGLRVLTNDGDSGRVYQMLNLIDAGGTFSEKEAWDQAGKAFEEWRAYRSTVTPDQYESTLRELIRVYDEGLLDTNGPFPLWDIRKTVDEDGFGVSGQTTGIKFPDPDASEPLQIVSLMPTEIEREGTSISTLGRFPNRARGTILHEYAHVRTEWARIVQGEILVEGARETIEAAQFGGWQRPLGFAVSRYALQNEHEFYAECFALFHSPDWSSLPDTTKRLVTTVLEGKTFTPTVAEKRELEKIQRDALAKMERYP